MNKNKNNEPVDISKYNHVNNKNNMDELVSKFKTASSIKRTRKTFHGTKVNRGSVSTRKNLVAQKMKAKKNAQAEIEKFEEKIREIKRAKLKAARDLKKEQLKKLKEEENKVQEKLNILTNAFNKMKLNN
jgi:mevalonate kinase